MVSFATNTNLQHYGGETTLSYLSQMTAIQFLQFTSAATGICMGVAMVRGFIVGSKDMGNFYVDFVRTLTRIFIPFCLVAALVLVALGVPQTLSGYTTVTTVEGATQSILVGPVASLVAIMQLGTNGGGYYGANSAYPFMNPNPASDILEIGLMLLLPTALIFVFGELLGKKREVRPILIGAYGLFAIDLAIAFIPTTPLGPGIETRIGGFLSAFWTVVTTAVTTGSVNTSLRPCTLSSSCPLHGDAHPGHARGKGGRADVHDHVHRDHRLHRGPDVREDPRVPRHQDHQQGRQARDGRLPHSSADHTGSHLVAYASGAAAASRRRSDSDRVSLRFSTSSRLPRPTTARTSSGPRRTRRSSTWPRRS